MAWTDLVCCVHRALSIGAPIWESVPVNDPDFKGLADLIRREGSGHWAEIRRDVMLGETEVEDVLIDSVRYLK